MRRSQPQNLPVSKFSSSAARLVVPDILASGFQNNRPRCELIKVRSFLRGRATGLFFCAMTVVNYDLDPARAGDGFEPVTRSNRAGTLR